MQMQSSLFFLLSEEKKRGANFLFGLGRTEQKTRIKTKKIFDIKNPELKQQQKFQLIIGTNVRENI